MTDVTTPVETAKRKAPEVTEVTMSDGRVVGFTGKVKLRKEIIFGDNFVSVRFDFSNAETRTFRVPDSLLFQAAGRGVAEKVTDELNSEEDVDDMVIAADETLERLEAGENWYARRGPPAGDGFAGASLVMKAIMEVSKDQGTPKTQAEVKAFVDRKLETAKAAGVALSRQDLYNSFRAPDTPTGIVYARLEREKKAKAAKFNAADLLAELNT